MKKIKVFGIAVATLGVAASIGGAIALYTKEAQKLEFIIGAGTHTDTSGTVSYKINEASNPTVAPEYYTTDDKKGDGLDATHTQIKYTFKLGATYNDVPTPMYTMGKVSISLTNVSTSLYDNLDVWAEVTKYTENSLGQYYYAKALMGEDVHITSTNTTYEGSADVAVASNGVQELVIYLKLKSTVANNSALYAKDEEALSYTLSVSWGAPSNDFNPAYIVSDKTGYQEDDAYMMAPNIGIAEGYKGYSRYRTGNEDPNNYPGAWQWVGAVKGADDLTLAKCRQDDKWSHGSDTAITKDTIYDVYWDGETGEGHGANFVARGA